MRIVGRIPDPRMQITVFENDGRFPVQFERDGMSQMYRFRKGPTLGSFGELRPFIDEAFRSEVLHHFTAMQRTRHRIDAKIYPADDTDDALPVII